MCAGCGEHDRLGSREGTADKWKGGIPHCDPQGPVGQVVKSQNVARYEVVRGCVRTAVFP